MDDDSQSHLQPTPATHFAVLLFTDIRDSTALKAKHGALDYRSAAEFHNQLFERLAAEEHLTLIKNTGDGYFARTTSVAAAVRFALRLQHGLRIMQWPGFPLITRVGIHAGEVADITTLGQADVLAPAADLVARVMSLAIGGQILLTRAPFDEARHFVREHPPVGDDALPTLTWLAHGPYLFKGCDEPVDVFEVGAAGLSPLAPPPDAEKARRAVSAGEEETLGWRPAIGLDVPGRAGWQLARKLGEGGFGEVWLAEQPKLKQRRVFKFCFDKERLRSFKRELTLFRLIRDALGERDDIARLYDVKLDEPPFFLESEFAEHGNLVEWCERRSQLAEKRANNAESLAETRFKDVAIQKDAKEQALQKSREQLRLMSRSDHATATELFQQGRWRAGMAYLGRAIRNDPENRAAGEHLWSALLHGTGDRDRLPNSEQTQIERTRWAEARSVFKKMAKEREDALQAQHKDSSTVTAGTASEDGTAQKWDAATGQLIGKTKTSEQLWGWQGFPPANLPWINTDRNRRLDVNGLETLQLNDATTGDPVGEPLRHKERIQDFNPNQDGTRVITASADATARIWDTNTGQPIGNPLQHAGSVYAARFSLDGIRVVTASADKTARIWDAETGMSISKPLQHEDSVYDASFSPDGTRVVTTSKDKTARIWDVASGQLVGKPLRFDDQVFDTIFSPDGTRLLTRSGNSVQIWDAASGQPMGEPMQHGSKVQNAYFSKEGDRITVVDGDSSWWVWDAVTEQFFDTPLRHESPVSSALFSTDGTRVMTVSWPRTIRDPYKIGANYGDHHALAKIWETDSGQLLGEALRN